MPELLDKSQANIEESAEKKQHDLLLRREARRKRILENAKGRLEKLSAADKSSSLNNRNKSYSEETYSDPEIEHLETINNYKPVFTSTATTSNHIDWDSTPLLSPAVVPLTKIEKALSTRAHVIVASVLTYVLLFLGIDAVISQSIFVLFLTLECLELIVFRQNRPLSPIVNMILMLSGINIEKAGAYMKVFGLLNKMVCDLGLFIFCFILSHGFYCVIIEKSIKETFYSF